MANIIRRHSGAGPVEPATPRTWEPARIFRELMGWDPFAEMIPSLGGREVAFAPSFEVKESKDGYVFYADLPGVRDEDLELHVSANRLTISGKREAEETKEDEKYYAYERSYGSFTRTFTLPDDASVEQIDARLEKGVLTVRVAKAAEARPRKIELASKANKPKA
jgi:HSP20 family protein